MSFSKVPEYEQNGFTFLTILASRKYFPLYLFIYTFMFCYKEILANCNILCLLVGSIVASCFSSFFFLIFTFVFCFEDFIASCKYSPVYLYFCTFVFYFKDCSASCNIFLFYLLDLYQLTALQENSENCTFLSCFKDFCMLQIFSCLPV